MSAATVEQVIEAAYSARVSCFTYCSDVRLGQWCREVSGFWQTPPPATLLGYPITRDYSVPENVLRVHYRGGSHADIELFTTEAK